MFHKFAAAVIAVSLLAVPALAQGSNDTKTSTAPIAAGQPSAKIATKPDVVKPAVKAKHVSKAHARKVHSAKAKHIKRVKMTSHRHHNHIAKHIKRPVKVNTVG